MQQKIYGSRNKSITASNRDRPNNFLSHALHLNLDDAWRDGPLNLPALDARNWAARLRFSAPPPLVEKFYGEFTSRLVPFILYGSGDFHYLSALCLRRLSGPVILLSFDTHPD